MSKQNPKDVGPLDIHTLMITDSGFDPYVGKSQQLSQSKPFLYERDIQTLRPLSQEEKLALLQWVNSKLPAPGLTTTMIALQDGVSHKFLISEQQPR